jgi:hypothetical protein
MSVGVWVGVGVFGTRVGFGVSVGVGVGWGVVVAVGLAGVVSARRWGAAQDANPVLSAARKLF